MDNTDTTAKHEPTASPRLTMTVPEVAAALGISRNHAYWMVAMGKIPARRLGRRYLVGRSALEQWLAEKRN